MPTKPKPPHARWQIILIQKRGRPLGVVTAATAEEAIEKAAELFGIEEPERRKRLAAKRIEEQ